jgi:hypothetical protein
MPPNQRTVFILDGTGTRALCEAGLRPDAAFQAAMHLAYYRCTGKVPHVTCFADLRSFRYGRVFPFSSTTEEMTRFVKTPTADNLSRAVEAHRREVKRVKTGRNPLQLLYSFLSGWEHIPMSVMISAALVLAVFLRKLTLKHARPEIWSSHIPALDGISLAGRAGARVSYVGGRAISGHYLIYRDQIRINFASKTTRFDYTRFARELKAVLKELIAMGRQGE